MHRASTVRVRPDVMSRLFARTMPEGRLCGLNAVDWSMLLVGLVVSGVVVICI
jgi:hypothetical protein